MSNIKHTKDSKLQTQTQKREKGPAISWSIAVIRDLGEKGNDIQLNKIEKYLAGFNAMAPLSKKRLITVSPGGTDADFIVASLKKNDVGVVVSKATAFSRPSEFFKFLRWCTENNKQLTVVEWSVTFFDADQPVTKMLLGVSEWLTKAVSESTKAGMAKRAEDGQVFGKAEIAPSTERSIVKMFKDRGMNPNEIAKELTAQDIPTARGGQWTRNTIVRILTRNKLWPVRNNVAVKSDTKEETTETSKA